ncbi:DEAD/DEAH box helicase family protein [Aerococcaceae bacterium WGS1372]
MLEMLRNELKEYWLKKGFDQPTAIQEQLVKEAIEGNSVVAISPTGTGKTLAYLLPILNKIEATQKLQAIILAPSKELAIQIADVAKEWGELVNIKTQTIVGGANIKRQIDKLKEKPELIVATPGRFQELQKNPIS